MSSIRLVIFGAGRSWPAAARRLALEAKKSGLFSKIDVFEPQDLVERLPRFVAEHGEFISANAKGYGYWIWKPAILAHALQDLQDSESGVLYLDAGCSLNLRSHEALERWRFYLGRLAESSGLFFRLRGDNNHSRYTKQATLTHFGFFEVQANLVAATAFFLRNDENSKSLLSEWLSVMSASDYRFVMDPKENEPQNATFIAHRHDQSILSLLLLSKPQFEVIEDETFFAPDWFSRGVSFPIWATRHKSRFKFRGDSIVLKVIRYIEQKVMP